MEFNKFYIAAFVLVMASPGLAFFEPNATDIQNFTFNYTGGSQLIGVPLTINGTGLYTLDGIINQEVMILGSANGTFSAGLITNYSSTVFTNSTGTSQIAHLGILGEVGNNSNPLNKSILLYYPMKNESSEIDFSFYSNNASVGSSILENGSIGYRRRIGGADVIIPDKPELNISATGDFFIEAIVTPGTLTSNRPIFVKFSGNTGILLIFQQIDTISTYLDCSVGDGTRYRYRYNLTIADYLNKNVYVACERDTTNDLINLFFDGRLVVSSADNTTGSLAVASPIYLGYDGSAGLSGAIDEFMFHQVIRGSDYVTMRNESFKPSSWSFYPFVKNSISNIYSCDSDASHQAYNFTFYGEADRIIGSSVDFSSVWTFNSSSTNHKTQSINITNSSSINICADPFDTFTVNATIVYGNTTYPDREFYLINNASEKNNQNISLYGLDSNLVTLTKIFLKDTDGLEKDAATIIIQKYYVDINQYLTVAMARTDFSGLALTKLVDSRTSNNAVFYRFLINDNGQILKTTTPAKLQSDPTDNVITLTINLIQNVGQTFNIFGKTSYSCTNTNVTIECAYTDTTGSLDTITMSLTKITKFSQSEVCSNSSTLATGTLNCSLGSNINGSYIYRVTALYNDGSTLLITEDSYNYLSSAAYGIMGSILALFVMLFMAFAGRSFGASGMIAMLDLGIIISALMGWIVIPITWLVGILLAGGIIAYVMRD